MTFFRYWDWYSDQLDRVVSSSADETEAVSVSFEAGLEKEKSLLSTQKQQRKFRKLWRQLVAQNTASYVATCALKTVFAGAVICSRPNPGRILYCVLTVYVRYVELLSPTLETSSSISSPSTLGVNNSTSMGLRTPARHKDDLLVSEQEDHIYSNRSRIWQIK